MSKSLTKLEEQKLKSAFELFDSENNETINPKELIYSMINFGYATKHPYLFKVICSLNQEGLEGGIDFEQFKDSILYNLGDRSSKENIGKMFDLVDMRNCGRLNNRDVRDLAERAGIKAEEKEINNIISKNAGDKQEITRDEFVERIARLYNVNE